MQSFARAGSGASSFPEFHGKQLPRSTEYLSQQSGGRWRRGARRSVEGDGCDM